MKKINILIVLILLAAFFRFYNLDYASPNPDELTYGNRAKSLVDGSGKIFYFDHPPTFMILSYLLQKIGFGLVEAGRMISAIAGVLAVLLIYGISLHIYNKKIAMISAFAFSFFAYHIYMSKTGQIESLMLTSILALYFIFLKAEKKDNILYYIAAGLVAGLSFWIKFTSLGAILVLLVYLLLQNRSINSLFNKKMMVFYAFFIILILPLIYFMLFGQENAISWQLSDRFKAPRPIQVQSSPLNSLIFSSGFLSGVLLNIHTFPPNLLGYLYVLAGLMPVAFVLLQKPTWVKEKKLEALLFLHFIIFFVFFVFYKGKLHYYFLTVAIPLVPIFAKTGYEMYKDIKMTYNTKLVSLYKILVLTTFICLLLINVYSSVEFLTYKGEFYAFEQATTESLKEQGEFIILSSHSNIVEYYINKSGREGISVLKIREHLDKSGKLNPAILENAEIKQLILKINYYDFYLNSSLKQEVKDLFYPPKVYGDSTLSVKYFKRK